MRGTEIVMSDVIVQSVSFAGGSLEIQFMDKDNLSEHEQKLEVWLLEQSPERPEYSEAYQELQSLLVELLDVAETYRRNPPLTIPARPRFQPGATGA